MKKTLVYEKAVTIPTYEAGVPEKNPLFIEKRAYQGSTGKVYPLPVTEKISKEKTDHVYQAVFLENDYLLVMILPELGGRIQRALDKTNNYDFIYYNHVIKPALVGLAGPWISGGIEFNWPQHHRPSTFMPVDYAVSENPDGSATVTIGETDRMYGTKGNAAITLYPDRAYIEIRGRLYNPTDFPQTFLWWANPAVSVNENTFSIFPPDVNAVMDHGKRAVSTFPIATGEYYKADYSTGVDISRYKNIRVPTSYMAAHSDFDFVGNYDEGVGAGLLHVADHHISPGKKQWTWGCGDFGKTWDKNLTDEDGPYIELMTGVFCDNQPDFTWLKPHEEKNFVQYFMPYRTVGRVSNATKDAVLGVDYLDEERNVLALSPFEYGREANRKLSEKASAGRIKICVSKYFPKAKIRVISRDLTSPGEHRESVYEKITDLRPEEAFVDTIPGLRDYTVEITDEDGRTLLSYREYVRENQPVPEPQEAMKKPAEIESLEELYLAGQHLEQYRHATFLPQDYYLEGLRRDPTDIRLNNAYGLLLLRNGQLRECGKYFVQAVVKQSRRNPNPYHGEVWLNLGLSRRLIGLWDAAYDAFYKATWSAETAGQAFWHLASIALRRKDYEQALQFVEEALLRQYHSMKACTLKAAVLEKLSESAASQELQKEYLKKRDALVEESLAIDPLYFPLLYLRHDDQAFLRASGGRIEEHLNTAAEFIECGLYALAVSVLELCPAEYPMKYYLIAYAEEETANLNASEAHHEKALAAARSGEASCPDYCFPNRLIEMQALTTSIRLLTTSFGHAGKEAADEAPMAHYYLGEFLYDKKRYREAVQHWEMAAREKPDFALTHRNLSIAYYNHAEDLCGDGLDEFEMLREKAVSEISEAVRLDRANSRLLLEQDQLLRRVGKSSQERLMILEEKKELLSDRYALMLAYVTLLNDEKQHEKALELLMHYTFHVWEGGEGKIAEQYKRALFALSEGELQKAAQSDMEAREKHFRSAYAYAERSLRYPDNLGEGKLDNVPDNQAHYLMGKACQGLGALSEAEKYFRLATSGSQTPEPVRYYNDQPSDYIYWQGLAFLELQEPEKARKSFHQLITFGERHIFDQVGYDFFAVSMPELDVYQDDPKERNDRYCRQMEALGRKGLLILGEN